MLLAIDVGNTQTVLGLFDGESLAEHRRLATDASRTGDELGALLGEMLDLESVDGICLSSTVPAQIREFELFAERWAKAPILVVEPGVRTGIPMRHDAPHQVGPDRIVNSVAAKERYGAPCIVVDFGTSTNFDVVSPQGEYVGGVLAPGIEVSMEALFARAARLTKVDFAEPPSAIGKTTEQALQSGLVYGFAGQVDRIVEEIRRELGAEARAVATGGLADLVVPHSRTIELVDPWLTLEGLRLVWELNRLDDLPPGCFSSRRRALLASTRLTSRRRRSRSGGRGGPRRPAAARPRAARARTALPARPRRAAARPRRASRAGRAPA